MLIRSGLRGIGYLALPVHRRAEWLDNILALEQPIDIPRQRLPIYAKCAPVLNGLAAMEVGESSHSDTYRPIGRLLGVATRAVRRVRSPCEPLAGAP